MSKKDFKIGLGNFLKESQERKKHEQTENQEHSNPEIVALLQKRIERYEQELYYWRNGLLTVTKFQTSLKEEGLTYNSITNTIESAKP